MSEFILNHLEHQKGDQYIVGHKFDGDHPQTHWVKNPRGKKFETASTENESEAFIYTDRQKAFEHIDKKVIKFSKSEAHYTFHAVIKNLRSEREGLWTA